MINKVFASNFVSRMSRTMSLNVNVMDEKGIIIASTMPDRVGMFHSCAWTLIKNGQSMMVTKQPDEYMIGVTMPGVNLRLVSEGETIGVIGVSGIPEEVTDIAKMAKLAFESMYEYEYRKDTGRKSGSGLWKLSYLLLKETPMNRTAVKLSVQELKLQMECPRIPFYIRLRTENRNVQIQRFLEDYRLSKISHYQDVVLPVEKGILILKSCRQIQDDVLLDYRQEFSNLLKEITEKFVCEKQNEQVRMESVRIYTAPVLCNLIDSRVIYEGLEWMAQLDKKLRFMMEAESSYVPDLKHFLTELIIDRPNLFMPGVLFEHDAGLIEKYIGKEHFLETAEGMIAAEMKPDHAARLLHLHRNSVHARLKKIRELLAMNPVSDSRDTAYFRMLYAWMSK